MQCTLLTSGDQPTVLDEEALEMQRVCRLRARWLARAILQTARLLRAERVQHRPYDIANEARLYWQLIPELAYRLGERSFANHERQDDDVRALSNSQLKFYCLHAWQNLSRPTTVLAIQTRVFFQPASAGNPLSLALERLLKQPAVSGRHPHRLERVSWQRGSNKPTVRSIRFNGNWNPETIIPVQSDIGTAANSGSL